MSRYEKYMVSACELYNLNLFKGFVQIPTINICVYGSGRSCEASKILDDLGYRSLFLDCGLAGLENLHLDYRQVVIERIKQFSQIFVFTNDIEKNLYRNTLDQLNPTLPNYFKNEVEFRKLIKSGRINLKNL